MLKKKTEKGQFSNKLISIHDIVHEIILKLNAICPEDSKAFREIAQEMFFEIADVTKMTHRFGRLKKAPFRYEIVLVTSYSIPSYIVLPIILFCY